MRILEPITIGGQTLRNRVAVTCHTFWFDAYSENVQSDQYARYLARMAEGGVALIGAQSIFVPPVDRNHPFPLEYLADRIGHLAESVHEYGAKLVVQSVHIGANLNPTIDSIPWEGQPLWGFSQVPSNVSMEQAHMMTGEEIESLVEGWGTVAKLVRDAGADGLELHGGHGYLLHQSMSPWMNMRDDEWGEPLRFFKSVLHRVRAGLGPNAEKMLGVRLPSEEFRDPAEGGHSREELHKIACALVDTGTIDYLNPSEGSSAWHYFRSVGTYRRPHGDFLDSVASLRAAVQGRVPVIGVGRITTIEEAEHALESGACDMVGMTRAHIADPDILKKLRDGERSRIRPCVGANACIDRIMAGTHVMCLHNAEAGREHRLGPRRDVDKPKKILVVGGGPAGLKTAEVAARRGHQVLLVEQGDTLGGRLAALDGSPAAELVESVRWLERELHHLDVEIALRTPAEKIFAGSDHFDDIVLATGSLTAPAPFGTDETVPVLDSAQAMSLRDDPAVRSVLVYDLQGTTEGVAVIEGLTAAGKRVVATTPLPTSGTFLGWTHLADHLPRLLSTCSEVHERVDVVRVEDNAVHLLSQLTGEKSQHTVDAVVVLQPRLANDSLRAAAGALGRGVHVVGDAEAPRSAMHAFLGGENLGRLL